MPRDRQWVRLESGAHGQGRLSRYLSAPVSCLPESIRPNCRPLGSQGPQRQCEVPRLGRCGKQRGWIEVAACWERKRQIPAREFPGFGACPYLRQARLGGHEGMRPSLSHEPNQMEIAGEPPG